MNNLIKTTYRIVLFLALVNNAVESAKILAVFTTPSKSHLIFSQNLLKHLTEIGHEVTVVSPFPSDSPMTNYRDIVTPIDDDYKQLVQKFTQQQTQSRFEYFKAARAFFFGSLRFSNDSIHQPAFRKIMNEENFDLIILPFFFNDFQVGLAAHFNCPLIVIASVGTFRSLNDLVGNPSSIATTPHLWLNRNKPMDFKRRLINFGVGVLEYAMFRYMAYGSEKYYNSNFPSPKYPTHSKAKANTALVFVNQHFSEGAIRPFVPNMIEIGGMQLKDKPDSLSANIQKWLDEAKNGAIWFSLGTNVKSSELSQDKLNVLINVFSKLKQRVLLKWEADDGLPCKLDNVLAVKWVPSQADVLAHKNVKLFITHAGLGSVVESKFHGVPIVAIPFYGDQLANANVAVAAGWAVKVDYNDMTETSLLASINEVLNNCTYTEIVQSLALLYRDRPMSALDTATYWIEYVIRHKGAKHMRFAGVNLNIFERNSVDVIAFILIVMCLFLKIVVFLVHRLVSKISKVNQKQKVG